MRGHGPSAFNCLFISGKCRMFTELLGVVWLKGNDLGLRSRYMLFCGLSSFVAPCASVCDSRKGGMALPLLSLMHCVMTFHSFLSSSSKIMFYKWQSKTISCTAWQSLGCGASCVWISTDKKKVCIISTGCGRFHLYLQFQLLGSSLYG